MEQILNVIDGLIPFLKDEIAMKRQMMFHADECLIDSQHRILVPNTLLQKVDIKKEVLFIGQLDKIELRNPLTYEKYLKASSETYEDVTEKVMSKNPDRNT